MAEPGITWGQISTLLFFGGFTWWAIKWVGRNLRAQIGEGHPGNSAMNLPKETIDAIVDRGLATPQQLFQMTPAEQRLLASTALAMASAARGTVREAAVAPAPTAHCPHCGTLVEEWPAEPPWRATCASCGSALLIRRDGPRTVLSYTPPA